MGKVLDNRSNREAIAPSFSRNILLKEINISSSTALKCSRFEDDCTYGTAVSFERPLAVARILPDFNLWLAEIEILEYQ